MGQSVQVRFSINHQAGANKYNEGTGFTTPLVSGDGPVPGMITVPVAGIDLDLSSLSALGGVAHIVNYDTVNFVTYGIWYGTDNLFFPLGEVGPQEEFPLRISRFLGETFGPGTGTGSHKSTVKLRFKAHGASCRVRVEIGRAHV